jgi:hypothetical protein
MRCFFLLIAVMATVASAIPMQTDSGKKLLPPLASDGVSRVCRSKAGATDQALGDAIGYVCGVIDCTPIQPGGDHYDPNTPKDHADWAMNAFYQIHKSDPYGDYQACFFNGAAEVFPALDNVLYLSTGNSLNDTTAFPSGVSVYDTIEGDGTILTYTSSPLTMKYNKTAAYTGFSLWAAGEAAGDVLSVRFDYDFTGDGTWNRSEVYNNWGEQVVPNYQSYNSGVGFVVATGPFDDLVKGVVRCQIHTAAGGGASRLLHATNAFASVVVIPYNN